MSKIIGREIEAGLAVESVRGTAKLTAEKWIKKTTAYISEKSEKINEDSTRGILEDSLNSRVVKKWVEGSLEGLVQADALGYLLFNVFGKVSSVGSTTYTHTFSVAQSAAHNSLSIFIKDGSIQERVHDNGMISSLAISASVDDYVRYVANFMASGSADSTDTPSYDKEYDFIGKDITIKIADTEAGLATAEAICVKGLDINFDQGLIENYCFGSYNPEDINNGKFSIEGSLTRNFIDTTFKELSLSDTSKYVQITIEGDADLGSGVHPKLSVLLNKVQFSNQSISGGSDELVEETIDFKAFFNETDGEIGTVTLVNLTSEYDIPLSA